VVRVKVYPRQFVTEVDPLEVRWDLIWWLFGGRFYFMNLRDNSFAKLPLSYYCLPPIVLYLLWHSYPNEYSLPSAVTALTTPTSTLSLAIISPSRSLQQFRKFFHSKPQTVAFAGHAEEVNAAAEAVFVPVIAF
jgi:hypothetical protein